MKEKFIIKKDNRSYFDRVREGDDRAMFTFTFEKAHRFDTYAEAKASIDAFVHYDRLNGCIFQIEKIFIAE